MSSAWRIRASAAVAVLAFTFVGAVRSGRPPSRGIGLLRGTRCRPARPFANSTSERNRVIPHDWMTAVDMRPPMRSTDALPLNDNRRPSRLIRSPVTLSAV